MANRKIGPFLLERKLGVGGMGIVYLATYEKNNRKVAVKVLSPAMSQQPQVLKRFEREMNILKKLKDPHIVQYFGGGKQGGQHFYAMELIDGGSLDEEIKERAPLDWEYVVDCGIQICRGLEKAHELGIIHRDLKPANLFISKKTGELKLGDFGIARDTTATALTAAGRTVGTYAYMAPEQIIGKPPVSRKTDLYSLGCVLFEMLTGRPPFVAETPAAMLMMHLDEDPPHLRGLNMQCPIWLENLINRLLAKDPSDRPFDAQATRTALEEVRSKEATQMGVSAQAASGGATAVSVDAGNPELKKILQNKKRKRKKKKKQPFHQTAWFLSLCLVALIGVGIWMMIPDGPDKMFEDAEAYLAQESDRGTYWGREKLKELIDTYPEHGLATLAQQQLDKLDMDKALAEATKAARTGLPTALERNEAKTRFIDALRYELVGDRTSALEKYRSLVELFKLNDEGIKEARFNSRSYQVYLMLTREKIAKIEADIEKGVAVTDPLILILQNMREADQQVARGNVAQARQKWKSLLELYSENQDYAPQMEYIRKRNAYVQKQPNAENPPPWDYSLLDNLQNESQAEPVEDEAVEN